MRWGLTLSDLRKFGTECLIFSLDGGMARWRSSLEALEEMGDFERLIGSDLWQSATRSG
jgi:hypothetical protein